MKSNNPLRNYFLLFVIFFCIGVYGQSQQRVWSTNDPFNQKVFVKNEGQFGDVHINKNSLILFAASLDGVEMFFTANGLTYQRNEVVMKADEMRGGEKEEEKMKITPLEISMKWEGANHDVQVIAERCVSHYFTYPNPNDRSGKSSLKALAYKKIIYKNIYPAIDVEYVFPSDSSGIKYSLVLHPGADPSVIRMKWSEKSILKDIKGNLSIKSKFGKFMDCAPKTFYENGESIRSEFELSGNTVSFKVDQLTTNSKSRTIIIDPWTTTPVFAAGAPYEVDYDYAGNVYVFGGTASTSYSEKKYNSAGVLQWTFNASAVLGSFYDDFALDRTTGISYIAQGDNIFVGAGVVQVSTAGAQTNLYPGTPGMDEMWRIVFNNCTKKCVIAGGGVGGSNQACILDPASGLQPPVNVLGSATNLHDMAILCSDNTSANCYMASTRSFQYPAVYDNLMMKCPIPSLTPAYTVPDNHKFYEDSYGSFYIKRYSSICGWNGMAASAKYLYTYDGKLLQRWNKNTGAFINNTNVTAAPDTFKWGGISVDDCDHIFVGVKASVVQYDTNFTVVATTPMATSTDTVYDVQLAPGNKLYVSGNNFVSFFQLSGISCTAASSFSITTSTGGSCSSATATATVSGGSGPYTYVWSPSGQTTATASGLSSGTYTVTVSDNSCNPPVTATVTVTGGTTSVTITSSPASCLSSSGSATVTVTTGTTPYTYQWSPSGGNSSAATGLSAGNYSVIVTDGNGCTSTKTVAINSIGGISATVNSTQSTCTNPSGTATVSPTSGSAPYTYVWNTSPPQSSQSVSGLSVGNYSVTITDTNGCTGTASVTIVSSGGITATVNSTQSSCSLPTGTATANPLSGSAPYTYVWSTVPPQGGQTATGLSVGNYSITITDANGCTTTSSVSITSAGGPTTTASAVNTILCNGGNNATASATPAGGSAPYTYSWNTIPPQITQTATGLSAGNYTVVVTDAGGCSAVAVINIPQPPLVTAVSGAAPDTCNSGQGSASATASGGTSPYNYLWSNGQSSQTATGLSPGTYSVLITDVNGCTKTSSASVGNTGSAVANAGPNVIITNGTSTLLNASGGVSYSWSTGQTTNPITVSPTITTTYTVTVTDANGCSDIDTVVVMVVEPIPACSGLIANDLFFLPNAFSPNKNGYNERFHLLEGKYFADCLTDFYIAIYNRWGEKVYEGFTPNFSWDGTYKGKLEGTAVFAYYVRAVVKNGEEVKQKGNLTLLR